MVFGSEVVELDPYCSLLGILQGTSKHVSVNHVLFEECKRKECFIRKQNRVSEDWVQEGTASTGWAQCQGFCVILGPLCPSLGL